MAIAAILLSFLLCSMAVHAADHTVTWNLGQDYSSWASTQTFTVGDNLVFNYGITHNVNDVDKAGYDSCDASNGTPYSGGSTTIPLTSPGSKYFICSTSNHCSSGGMKLAVTVQAAGSPGGSPPPSGTPPATPSPPASPNTPPAPATPNTPPSPTPPTSGDLPPPPPPPSGAEGSFGSLNSLLVGSSLVLATLFAFMG